MRIVFGFSACSAGYGCGSGELSLTASVSPCALVLIRERNELRLMPGQGLSVGDEVDCRVYERVGGRGRWWLYFGKVIHVFESAPPILVAVKGSAESGPT